MRRTRLLAIVVGLTTLAIPLTARAPQGAKPRLMTVRDTQNMVSVGSPAISPDDQWVLYTRARPRLGRRAVAHADAHLAREDRRHRRAAAHLRRREHHVAGVVARRHAHRVPVVASHRCGAGAGAGRGRR